MAFVCGIDEAGRGALFGPLVVAGCVVRSNFYLEGLNDSKVLSPQKRLQLFHQILLTSEDYYWIFIGPRRVEKFNILNCSIHGFRICIKKLLAETYIVDGPYKPEGLKQNIFATPKADRIYPAVMCASIIAKVVRDSIISWLSERYPVYCLEENKGYPTETHRLALLKHGRSALHRKNFSFSKERKKTLFDKLESEYKGELLL
ncbi:MAG: ribonuclease HII [Deltaproteobacteria bacterium]|nr:ribonuclease HII [Deltaproteobacteria bacterium]MCX7952785.1 ribonuclease HII [Deltaproteobacteria bacterium]